MSWLAALRRLGWMVLGIVVFVVAIGLVQAPLRPLHVPHALGGILVAAVALAVYWAWVRYVERREPTELARGAIVPEGAGGLVLGIALFSVVIGILALAGAFSVAGYGAWPAVASGLIGAIVTAIGEEIVFRGWLFRTVRDIVGTWIGVAVSAVVFGLLHAFNPGASPVSTIAIALEAGVLLALAYAATGRLWLPIGIHAGWNFAEGSIFGSSVSGHAPDPSLLHGVLHGPVVLTGGIFGPEASVVGVIVCMVAAAAFAVRIVRAPRRTQTR
jgi:membrane protease YdiL (CAAX protease family)